MKLISILLLSLSFAVAQPAIETPLLGYMQDAEGSWHTVLGTAGNFVLGPVVPEPPALAASSNHIERRGEAIYVIAPDGGTVDILPPDAKTAVLVENGVLYSTPQEVVLRRFRSREIHFPAEGVTALKAMSPEYVQVSADRQLALRIEDGREAMFVLPKPADVAPAPPAPVRRLPTGAPQSPRRQRQ